MEAIYLDPTLSVEDIPELIYERKEIRDIIKPKVKAYFEGASPSGAYLIEGLPGSGKTISITHMLSTLTKNEEIPKENIIYISGHMYYTPKMMLSAISASLGIKNESIKTNPEYCLAIFNKINEEHKRYIIVVDDIEKIYQSSTESPKYQFLLSLLRAQYKIKPLFYFITNSTTLYKSFGVELRDSIATISFDAYIVNDLYQILAKRAGYCIPQNYYTEDDLLKIAKEVYNNPLSGDKANARKAIKILAESFDMARTNNKELYPFINTAIDKIRTDDYVKLLRKFNKHMLILIQSICSYTIQEKAKHSKFSNPLLEYDSIKNNFFKNLEQHNSEPPSIRQLTNMLEDLQNHNILSRLSYGKYIFIEDSERIEKAFQSIDL